MWTPNLKFPLDNLSIDIASSKSFASSPSIVNIFKSLISNLLSISSCDIGTATFWASSNTFLGNSSGSPCALIIESISTSFSPFGPNTSIILPSGFLPACGHIVIWTTTLSPSFAPLKYFLGIYISWLNFFSSAITNPKVLFDWNSPTTFVISLSSTFIIAPSALLSSVAGLVISATTLSLCIAPFTSAAGINKSCMYSSSDSTNPNPFLWATNLPTKYPIDLGEAIFPFLVFPIYPSSSNSSKKL